MLRNSLRPSLLPVVPYRGIKIPSRKPSSGTAIKPTKVNIKSVSPSSTKVGTSISSSPYTTTTVQQLPTYGTSPIVEQTVRQVAEWAKLPQKNALVSKLAGDSSAVSFVMKFVDNVMRVENSKTAAAFLSKIVSTHSIPSFMSSVDRALVTIGGPLAPYIPSIVIQSAKHRMRSIVSSFISTVENIERSPTPPPPVQPPSQSSSSFPPPPSPNSSNNKPSVSKNVNLLGEAVLGKSQAALRKEQAIELINNKDVDYISIKVSCITSKLNRWDYEGSLKRIVQELRPLFENAVAANPQVFINLDMEEYHDLQLTVDAFVKLLSEEQFKDMNAGIVLQAYLPDALPTLQYLVNWANNERQGNGEIKVRLVKGANLAMEKVEAELKGWEQAPYTSKSDTDANYLRCLDWVLTPENMKKVRIGVASHNLFTLAFAKFLAEQRDVLDRIGFENLTGMTPTHTPILAQQGVNMLLYTPVCKKEEFESAISYLFRRFEETSAPGNFLNSLPSLPSNPDAFKKEEIRFNTAYTKQNVVSVGPRRKQESPANVSKMTLHNENTSGDRLKFINEPDVDPILPNVRNWIIDAVSPEKFKPVSSESWVETIDEMDKVLERAHEASKKWKEVSLSERRKILTRAGDAIVRRRAEFFNAMVNEGSKTLAEADIEISEAVDFANYYGLKAEQDLPSNFEPFGVVTVAAPWNFPSAIGGGGAFSSLASGNAVILKPSPNTPRCLELIAECAWEAGVPKDVLQFVRCPENEVGKHLITNSSAVILTGGTETADLFRSWKPDLKLFAETSGKNSLVISPAADIDQAVSDLVKGAFGNTGQKCSASSLAICIGDVYESERFRRQLKDAVESIGVGPSTSISTSMGPVIEKPGEKLHRALTQLEDGEEWLVEPRCLDADGEGRLWTPGVRMNVKQNSWFHQNEVFGPVLGVMKADSLEHALEIQNGTIFGLTGGIHSLDDEEIKDWKEKVQVGNAYINRGTTGAIVQRQCFGGWKQSNVGPGAKAGGPNYIQQFGTIRDDNDAGVRDDKWLAMSILSDEEEWESRFSKEVDPSALFCESNVFRYRPLQNGIAVRVGPNANAFEIERVRAGIHRCGVDIITWSDATEESEEDFANRLGGLGIERVRVVGDREQGIINKAGELGVHVADAPVLKNARFELLHYLREQSVSQCIHRFGNVPAEAARQ